MSRVGKKRNSKIWRIYSMFIKELKLISNDKFALLLVFIPDFLPMNVVSLMLGGGYLSLEDLSSYKVEERDPLRFERGGKHLYTIA